MSVLFDDRERAAEYGFAHAETLRFLAAREGVEALGAWAAKQMGVEDATAYADTLVGFVLGGASQAALLARVRGDLLRAGVSDVVEQAGSVLDKAIAEAYARLHDTKRDTGAAVAAAAPVLAEHRRHGFWGWDV